MIYAFALARVVIGALHDWIRYALAPQSFTSPAPVGQ